MRVPMIAGNWKMNTTLSEATELVGKMLPELQASDHYLHGEVETEAG